MYELKTKPTDTDPLQVIAAIPNEKKRADARMLLKIFEIATGKPPVVWGEKMIGYGNSAKSCVYINKLADIDTTILTKMISAAMSYTSSI